MIAMFSLLSTTAWSLRWQAADALENERVRRLGFDAPATPVVSAELKSQRRLAVYGMTLVAAGLGACATQPARVPLQEAEIQLANAAMFAAAGHDAYAAALVVAGSADARLADLTAQSATAAKAAAENDKNILTIQRETNRSN
jgi:hypothetical protein